VAQQFLHGADVLPGFEQVRGERVAQGMRRDRLDDSCPIRRPPDRTLHALLVEMMALHGS
jgi:hypothetical protein